MRGRERERALGRRTHGKRIAQAYERFRFQDRGQPQQEVGGYDKRIYNQAIPFFFTNFPEEWSFEQIWHTFNRICLGSVLEIDCLVKRDRLGRQFGFVRFLEANKPRYTKRDPLKNPLPINHPKAWIWRQQSCNGNVSRPSYAEILKAANSRMEDRSEKERREEGAKQRYRSSNARTYRCSKGNGNQNASTTSVYSVTLIPNLQEKFFMEGVFFCKIRPIGGRLVLLEGKDYEDLKELVETGKDLLGNWFEDVKPWTPTVVATERFAWIRCQGLPVHAWKSETFETFGRLWGNFVSLDDSTISKKRFDAARFLITTPSTESISKSITVKINGESFTLKFSEEESTNILFTMRSNRIFQAPREEYDEESSSTDNQNVVDSNLDENILEQLEFQTMGIEGDGAKAFSENDVATPNMEGENENEMASQNTEVASKDDEVVSQNTEVAGDKVEGNKRGEEEEISTGPEIVEELEGMAESRTRFTVANSNFQRLAESRRIEADLDMVKYKADEGNFEKDSQESTNADMDSCDKSYQQKNKLVVDYMGSGKEERSVKDLNNGLPTKDMGLQVEIGPIDPHVVDKIKPSYAGPQEQNVNYSNRSKMRNRKSDSSFWDDFESESGIEANWMNRNEGRGKRKKKRRAKSCASVYRNSGGLEAFLVQQKSKGQSKVAVKTKKEVWFEKDLEKPVADDSINNSCIQNCNKSIKVRSRKRNMEALWSRVKEFGVTAQGEETPVL
ncbi:hypothetical protein SLEP1_g14813 [Rubroshorea leprosula]|uniref:RRM domain-containing protein n=1 Tax=Rubroshorea leprosula TaxID=152421 RepID=A0AAV5IRD7_9ROSI|nr:hypothetical protein SLEP1_g14813 [Rubroshorea leprosula]